MPNGDPLDLARGLPRGARFYKCALQVNPFAYLRENNKKSAFTNEEDYNRALVGALRQAEIEVIALADHYKVRTSEGLRKAAEAAGIAVFPGFEARTKEGVHLLCVFERDRTAEDLERVIGACGIHDATKGSPVGSHDVLEFLAAAPKWGMVCIAAHVTVDGGLLVNLAGQARVNAWLSPDLLACAIPGAVSELPDPFRGIVGGQMVEYQRPKGRAVAVLNAQDVKSPEDVTKPGASCWIKMSQPSIQGLRQAFLDPDSRIRLNSAPPPEDHVEFVALTWQGGFLDGAAVRFNENLNVLVGGRGTGKSTVIESIRYVLGLQPIGEQAKVAADGIVKDVLRAGTKVSLLVRSPKPDPREYRIERTVPNPPVVRGESGEVLSFTPADVAGRAEVFGQHEIAELSRDEAKRTRLLERFVQRDPALVRRKTDLKRELERSRTRALEVRHELGQVVERLGTLPALEQMLARYQDAGLEDKLKEQTLFIREERVLRSASERLAPYQQTLESLQSSLPIDTAFLTPGALKDLPDKALIAGAGEVLNKASRSLADAAKSMAESLANADAELRRITGEWQSMRKAAQDRLDAALRSLQRSRVDAEEFLRLRQQIEDLRPLRERQASLEREAEDLEKRRRNLLAEWEEVKRQEFSRLERAARGVTGRLLSRVRVQVRFEGDREPLLRLVKERGGRVAETLRALKDRETLSLRELADAIREGASALPKLGIRGSQAEQLAQAGPELAMRVEELDLGPTTWIELNTASEGQSPEFRNLESLSTGQKATAILLLLLLESDAPLVVDQPEDDLDNRFITEGIVPKMREEKRQRQFVFATHNANIPVLGDAEQIVGLRALGEAGTGRAEVPTELTGSIDSQKVRELVEELLEGGREAFELRRLKYGF